MHSEVIIIGGGLGGLSAGAYLAQNNIKVTLIEEQPHVGGYVVAFKRDQFIFDVALHAIPGCAPAQPFHNLLNELKIAGKLKFIKLQNAFNVNLGNYNFLIPNSFSEFFYKLELEFPEEKSGLIRLKTYISNYGKLYYDVVEGHSDTTKILTKFIPKITDFLKKSYISTDAFLSGFIKDRRLKSVLYQAAIFFGEPMDEFPAINFIIMFYLLFNSGMYTIRGGGQVLTNELESKMRNHGAKIITNERVQSIQIRNKRAKAVTLKNGQELKCSIIISNINTPELVHNLITPGKIPIHYIQAIESMKPSLSILQLHLGLDCNIEEIGIKHYLNVFFPDDDIDSAMHRQNNSEMIEGYSVIAPGINYSEDKSNVRRILSIVGGVSAERWIGLDAVNYKNQKKQITRQIINILENHYPGIIGHIKTIDLTTPNTFRSYTKNPLGAILGFKAERGRHRTLLKISKFPIKNIFLANAWTNRLGGFMQTIQSGVVAAKNSVNYLDKLN